MSRSSKTAEVTAAPREQRAVVEDTSVKEIPGASPDAVYAELAAAAERAAVAPPELAPVEVMDSVVAPTGAVPNADALAQQGGVVSPDGTTIRFGDKVFFADADKRKTVPRTMNLAAGPRIVKMPEPGVFLAATKSFRSVPYRHATGAVRVDH